MKKGGRSTCTIIAIPKYLGMHQLRLQPKTFWLLNKGVWPLGQAAIHQLFYIYIWTIFGSFYLENHGTPCNIWSPPFFPWSNCSNISIHALWRYLYNQISAFVPFKGKKGKKSLAFRMEKLLICESWIFGCTHLSPLIAHWPPIIWVLVSIFKSDILNFQMPYVILLLFSEYPGLKLSV